MPGETEMALELVIDGEMVPSERTFGVLNPATEETLAGLLQLARQVESKASVT